MARVPWRLAPLSRQCAIAISDSKVSGIVGNLLLLNPQLGYACTGGVTFDRASTATSGLYAPLGPASSAFRCARP